MPTLYLRETLKLSQLSLLQSALRGYVIITLNQAYHSEKIMFRARIVTLVTRAVVVSFTIGTIHTCNIFDITIIVVMSEMHVRIMCRCITWNVIVSQLSLVEARVTHVRANNEHSTRPKRV